MVAGNSAAQVSTRLNTRRTPAARRAVATSPSVALRRAAIRASVRPSRLARRSSSGGAEARSQQASSASSSTIAAISRTNQGSIRVTAATSPAGHPWRSAEKTANRRSQLGSARRRRRRTGSASRRSRVAHAPSSSRAASPFISASRKVPPIAITSPTDFIEVPRVVAVPGNFSNAQRGIFTTV